MGGVWLLSLFVVSGYKIIPQYISILLASKTSGPPTRERNFKSQQHTLTVVNCPLLCQEWYSGGNLDYRGMSEKLYNQNSDIGQTGISGLVTDTA